jgi:hypothetical protein
MSDASGTEDIHVRITCPHCRRQFQKTAAWIAANAYVRCDFCREPMGLSAYKAQAAAAAKASVAAAEPVKSAAPAKAAPARKAPAKAAAAKKAKPKPAATKAKKPKR